MRVTPEILAAFKTGIHVHYKGPKYLAIGLGEDSTNRAAPGRLEAEGMESTQEPMVTYIPLEGEHIGQIKHRELWQWSEVVEFDFRGNPRFRMKRFTPIDEWKKLYE